MCLYRVRSLPQGYTIYQNLIHIIFEVCVGCGRCGVSGPNLCDSVSLMAGLEAALGDALEFQVRKDNISPSL